MGFITIYGFMDFSGEDPTLNFIREYSYNLPFIITDLRRA